MSRYAPSTIARTVAYVRAFFCFCIGEGLMERSPAYGVYFVRPPAADLDDQRIRADKRYNPEELRRLWSHAGHLERAWMALGLNGGLDNADLANLPMPERGGVLDLEAGVLDYRRRKAGRVRRVIPLRPLAVLLIRHYLKRHRPQPADPQVADRLFLTPTGLPLQRPGGIDYLAMRWDRLMRRAGLRSPLPRRRRAVDPDRQRQYKAVGSTSGRGFRSLRTTMANAAPRGWRDELELLMGHRGQGVLVRNYLEKVGIEQLRELVELIWHDCFTVPNSASTHEDSSAGEPAAPSPAWGRRRSGGKSQPAVAPG